VPDHPDSPLRFTVADAEQVVTALAEILPADRYWVCARPGMGHDGVQVTPLGIATEDDPVDPHWYFDSTYGGDDGHTDHLRVYYTTADIECVDDEHPEGAPRADDDPLAIARWIVTVVARGAPDTSHDAGS